MAAILPYLISVVVVATIIVWQIARAEHLTFRELAEAAAILIFLLVRGLLLWLVIPAAILLWLVLLPTRPVLGRRYLSPGRVIGWLDLNVSALIGQALLRPIGRPARFVPWSQIEEMIYRTKLTDPW